MRLIDADNYCENICKCVKDKCNEDKEKALTEARAKIICYGFNFDHIAQRAQSPWFCCVPQSSQ